MKLTNNVFSKKDNLSIIIYHMFIFKYQQKYKIKLYFALINIFNHIINKQLLIKKSDYKRNKTKTILKTFIIISIFFIFFNTFAFAMSCGEEANPALKTICDIIMFLQGRIGRSLATFSVMLAAWQFTSGQFKWQEMLTLAIGIGIFFAPKTFALWLLPEYIQGIKGDGYDVSVKYTPDEIITCACPNLR